MNTYIYLGAISDSTQSLKLALQVTWIAVLVSGLRVYVIIYIIFVCYICVFVCLRMCICVSCMRAFMYVLHYYILVYIHAYIHEVYVLLLCIVN